MTLEEVLKQSETGDVQGALKTLGEFLKFQDKDKFESLLKSFNDIGEANRAVAIKLDVIAGTLEKILTRPDQEQKDIIFPSVQEVSMQKPDWYEEYDWDEMYENWTKMLVSAFAPFFSDLKNTIIAQGNKTRDLPIKKEEPKESEPVKTVNSAAVRSRRTTQWKIATYPQVTGTVAIISSGDGKTYYLPSAVIQNSETIRLNGDVPLSHGVDYTISGNKVTYFLDQTTSQQEIRYQTK